MFNSIKVYAHPRSGSNYLAELVDLNFTKTGNYKNVYGDHTIPPKDLFDDKDVGYLYIKRNFSDVSKSVFNLRTRFGLDVDTYDKFLESHYSEMFNRHLVTDVKLTHAGKTTTLSKIVNNFSGIDMKPEEYHLCHINSWLDYGGLSNVLIINYEDLIADFEKEMKKIANFIGSRESHFTNLKEKVGYIANTNNSFLLFQNHKVLQVFRSLVKKLRRRIKV